MKQILLLLLLPTLLFSQNNSKFIYSVTVIKPKDSKMMEMMETISPNFINLANSIEFTLLTDRDKSSSSFIINENSVPTDDAVNLYLNMSDYTGQINQEKDSLFVEKNLDTYDKKYTIKDTINRNWEIYNESKEIFGYRCYKAVCVKTVINEKGIFKNDVIAWFCPQIPYQFGPIGYGKLPGLIFELQTKYALFGIKTLQLESKETIKEINRKRIFLPNIEFENIVLKHIENRRALLQKN